MSVRGSDPSPALHPTLALLSLAMGIVGMGLGADAARNLGLRATLVAGEACLVAPALLLIVSRGRSVAQALALRRLDARAVILSLAAGLALWGASLGLMNLQALIWKPPEAFLETFRRLHLALRPRGPLDALWSLATIAVVPAACEELLFRGVLLASLLRVMGATPALVLSSLLFGLVHVELVAALPPMFDRVPFALMVGLGLGVLRLRTASLWSPILAHGLLNAVTFLIVLATGVASESVEEGSLPLGAALLAAGSCLFAVFLRFLSLTPREPGP